MNTTELLTTMWLFRKKRPDIFATQIVTLPYKKFTLLSKQSPVHIISYNNEAIDHMANLTYCDQNPKGQSKEALMVDHGEKLPGDIGWLYLQCLDINMRIWLGKIIDGVPTVIRECEYLETERKIKVYQTKLENVI